MVWCFLHLDVWIDSSVHNQVMNNVVTAAAAAAAAVVVVVVFTNHFLNSAFKLYLVPYSLHVRHLLLIQYYNFSSIAKEPLAYQVAYLFLRV